MTTITAYSAALPDGTAYGAVIYDTTHIRAWPNDTVRLTYNNSDVELRAGDADYDTHIINQILDDFADTTPFHTMIGACPFKASAQPLSDLKTAVEKGGGIYREFTVQVDDAMLARAIATEHELFE